MPSYLSPGVYVEEVASGSRPIEGVGTSVAAFVGPRPDGPAQRADAGDQLEPVRRVLRRVHRRVLPRALRLRLLQQRRLRRLRRARRRFRGRHPANGSAPAAVAASARAALPAGEPAQLGTFAVSRPWPARRPLSVEVADPEGEGPAERFKLIVKDGGKAVETLRRDRQEGQAQLRRHPGQGALQAHRRGRGRSRRAAGPPGEPDGRAGGARRRPRRPGPGGRRRSPGPAEYLGDSADRTGFGGLEAVDEISMVAVPDLMAAYQRGAIDLEAVKAVQLGLIAHCELMGDRVAVIDPPPGMNARQIRVWRQETAGYDSKYAALYYPWVKVFDPATGQTRLIPPSGHIAGIWARNDSERGVHKAPGQRGRPRRGRPGDPDHPRRAGPAQPDRRQLHPRLPRPRHPRLGRAHPLLRPGLALPQRPPVLQLPGGVDPARHPVGGVRAERPRAVGPYPAQRLGVPGQRVAQRRAVRRSSRRTPSTSSATRRPTRRSRSTWAGSSARSASRRSSPPSS